MPMNRRWSDRPRQVLVFHLRSSVSIRGHGNFNPSSRPLDQSPLGQRDDLGVADDEVIEQSDVDQRESVAQPAGDRQVGLARFGHAGRVIVATMTAAAL